jgi:hypothetical protein
MDRKIGISIVASAILASSAIAQNITLNQGWNLVGSSVSDVNTSEVFTEQKGVDIVWGWNATSQKWKVSSPNTNYTQKINTLKDSGAVLALDTISANNGFWVNVSANTTVTLDGDAPTTDMKVSQGWNLVSFAGDNSVNIEEIFSDSDKKYAVWEYDSANAKWNAWTNIDAVATALSKVSDTVGALSQLTPGKGYWVQAYNAGSVNYSTTPPEATLANFVYVNEVIGDGATVVNLAGAKVYNSVTGELYGETDAQGRMTFGNKGIENGTALKVCKDGYTSNLGIVKDNVLILTLAKIGNNSVDLDPTTGDEFGTSVNTPIISNDYSTVLIEKTGALKQSITVAPVTYMNGPSLPKITNNITFSGDSEATTPEELSIIGAVNFSFRSGDKGIVNPSELNGQLKFSYQLEKFIGDLNAIFTGLTGSTNDNLESFTKNSYSQLINALESKDSNGNVVLDKNDNPEEPIIGLYMIQQDADGTWSELGEAWPVYNESSDKISLVLKTDKDATNLNEQTRIETLGSGNIAYVIKTNFVKGSTNVCFKQQGYRMNDGLIVENDENNNTTYSWIDQPVEDLVLIGDENVINNPVTDDNGCATVEYKVPFLSPMYELSAISPNNFDKAITVDVEFGNLDAPYASDVKIYKIPERATIEGYVRSRINGADEKAVSKAIVTLQDPQILTENKVLVENEDGKQKITLEPNPNVTYTYTLSQEDDENSTVIKTGKLSDVEGVNVLTQKEIEDIIYSADATKNPWINAPYGNYIISVKAEHEYAEDNMELTEEMLVTFRAKVDEGAVLNAFNFSVNQGDSPYYLKNADGSFTQLSTNDTNSNNVPDALEGKELGAISVFGGKEIGVFKALMKPYEGYASASADNFRWDVDVLHNNPSNTTLGTPIDQNLSKNPYYQKLIDTNGNDINLVLSSSFENVYLPFSNMYKLFNDNFATMTAIPSDITQDDIDWLNNNGFTVPSDIKAGDNVPLYRQGFMVMQSYIGEYVRYDDGVEKTYVNVTPSYTDISSFKLNSVDDFSDIKDFKVSANEAIAFSARYTTTEDNGYYHISQIAPEVIPSLELTVRAEGHEYGAENERLAGQPQYLNGQDNNSQMLTTDGTMGGDSTVNAGDVLRHDFMLNRIAPLDGVTPVIPEINPLLPYDLNQTFENDMNGWTVEKLMVNGSTSNVSDDVKWQILSTTEDDKKQTITSTLDNLVGTLDYNYYIPEIAIIEPWIEYYGYSNDDDSFNTLLAPYEGDKYAWMGNIATGTYLSGDGKAVATALVSPVIDFSDYPLAVLNFKQWFEVAAFDASWDTAFVGFEIVEDVVNDISTAGATLKMQDAMGSTMYADIGQKYVTRITPDSPVINDWDTVSYFSNNGMNSEPTWTDFKIKLDMLAGKKAKIVFGFFTGDNLYNYNRGWGVDNIFIQDSVDSVLELPPVIPEVEIIAEDETVILPPVENTPPSGLTPPALPSL